MNCSVSKPTHLDLFSGIGGFTIAAERAGFQTIAFSEIDPYACKILKRHWPDVPNLGDVRNIHDFKADLVTAGVPCQPASYAGKRRGSKDDRWLWPEALRVLGESGARWALFENVPGLMSLDGGVEFERVLSQMESLGYAVRPIVVPACAVDAPHRRDRVWIVANSEGTEQERSWSARQRRNGPANDCKIVAHANESGLQGWNSAELRECGSKRPTGAHGAFSTWPEESEWFAQSGMGRVAHGIPNRSHRLRCLGNAIVPQVAEILLRTMLEVDKLLRE